MHNFTKLKRLSSLSKSKARVDTYVAIDAFDEIEYVELFLIADMNL